MSKVPALARFYRESLFAMLLVSIVMLSTGCGGSSAAASPPPPSGNNPPPVTPPPPAPIQGVATPTSVAVVTATNAQ